MAAYNCGENRVQKEITEQKVADYYRLNLPTETERYLYRIAAIKIIMENPRRYGYMLPEEHLYRPVKFDTVTVNISNPIHITDLAQAIGTDFKVIKELNPELLAIISRQANTPLKFLRFRTKCPCHACPTQPGHPSGGPTQQQPFGCNQ